MMNFARGQVRGSINAELQPYQVKGRELGNEATTSEARLAGYGQTQNTLLEGIQKGAESSAKTFENRVAENAIKAQGEINTTGQNAITNNAGYIDPQLAQQLQAERANVAGISRAGEVRAGEMGQNETNFMANLRAAAGQRVTEQQGSLASRFQTAKNTLLGQENKIRAKEGPETSKLFQNLLGQQEKFGNARTANALRAAATEQRENANKRTVAGANARNANTVAGANARNANTVAGANSRNAATNATRLRISAADIAVKVKALQQKAENTKGKKVSSAEQKAFTEFGAALRMFEEAGAEASQRHQKEPDYGNVRKQLAQGFEEVPVAGKGKALKLTRVTNPALIKAAEEVWRYHSVGRATKAALGRMGLQESGWSELIGGG